MILAEILGIVMYEPSIITIGANSAVGKTSLQIILASEKLKEGKRVLYISNDEKAVSIFRKFNKINTFDETDNLVILDYHSLAFSNKELIDVIKDSFDAITFDLIVLDSLSRMKNDELKHLLGFLKSKNLNALISTGIRFHLKPAYTEFPTPLLHMSDYVFSLSKKDNLTRKEKIFYFFRPWKQKPNRKINLIKNRSGKEKSVDISLNFETLKLN